jgi:hypothetical protein
MDGFHTGFHLPISVESGSGTVVYNSVSRVGMTGFRGALVAGWVSAGVGGEGGGVHSVSYVYSTCVRRLIFLS